MIKTKEKLVLAKAGEQIAPWKLSLVEQIEKKVRSDARQHLHEGAIKLREKYGMNYDHAIALFIDVASGTMEGEK